MLVTGYEHPSSMHLRTSSLLRELRELRDACFFWLRTQVSPRQKAVRDEVFCRRGRLEEVWG